MGFTSHRALEARLSIVPRTGRSVNSCIPSSVGGRIINQTIEAGSRRHPLTSDTDEKHKQDKCIYFEEESTRGLSGRWECGHWRALFVLLYFNKHQIQTRLGDFSFQNVRAGSAISHNKWAHAKRGIFTMQNSVFGEHCADAGLWYAIILKSIKSPTWNGRFSTAAFVFTRSHWHNLRIIRSAQTERGNLDLKNVKAEECCCALVFHWMKSLLHVKVFSLKRLMSLSKITVRH